jgi:hypothetical protein
MASVSLTQSIAQVAAVVESAPVPSASIQSSRVPHYRFPMITPISQTTKTNTRPQTITCSRKSNISLEREHSYPASALDAEEPSEQ